MSPEQHEIERIESLATLCERAPPKPFLKIDFIHRESALTISAQDRWIQAGIPALVLAPMEGVTDVAMRALLTELRGFRFCVAEFLRISQTVPGVRAFQRHVPELMHGGKTPSRLPVQMQLLGADPGKLAQAAVISIRAGARAVDLNFGCPARTVNRHDGGATLLQYPDRIREIVAAVRAAVPVDLPVSAKMRLGWDSIHSIQMNAERAAEGGADWIPIHARTKTQGYRPPAYWKPLGEVRARLGRRAARIGEAKKGKSRPVRVIEAMRRANLGSKLPASQRQKMSDAHKARGTRPPAAGEPWTAEEVSLLGTMKDRDVAARTGRTVGSGTGSSSSPARGGSRRGPSTAVAKGDCEDFKKSSVLFTSLGRVGT